MGLYRRTPKKLRQWLERKTLNQIKRLTAEIEITDFNNNFPMHDVLRHLRIISGRNPRDKTQSILYLKKFLAATRKVHQVVSDTVRAFSAEEQPLQSEEIQAFLTSKSFHVKIFQAVKDFEQRSRK